MERDLDRIIEKRNVFRSGVREYLEEYSSHLETSAQTTWNDSISNINSLVKAHAKKIRAKAHQVSPPLQPLTEFEKAQLDIQMRQLNLMEGNAAK